MATTNTTIPPPPPESKCWGNDMECRTLVWIFTGVSGGLFVLGLLYFFWNRNKAKAEVGAYAPIPDQTSSSSRFHVSSGRNVLQYPLLMPTTQPDLGLHHGVYSKTFDYI